jgi:hypothetical protein
MSPSAKAKALAKAKDAAAAAVAAKKEEIKQLEAAGEDTTQAKEELGDAEARGCRAEPPPRPRCVLASSPTPSLAARTGGQRLRRRLSPRRVRPGSRIGLSSPRSCPSPAPSAAPRPRPSAK